MEDKTKDWIISVGLNTIILTFPFLISLVYKEPIQEKTLTLAIAMFLMSVAIGSTEKVLFYLFFVISFFLVACYGAIPNESHITTFYCYQSILAGVGIIALAFDKYDIHVRKGQPLNYF
jgi:hypothetical protein